jgi:hypothetical protein
MQRRSLLVASGVKNWPPCLTKYYAMKAYGGLDV